MSTNKQANKQVYRHYNEKISRSDPAGATKKKKTAENVFTTKAVTFTHSTWGCDVKY